MASEQLQRVSRLLLFVSVIASHDIYRSNTFADHIFFCRRSAFGSVEIGDRWENMFYVLLLSDTEREKDRKTLGYILKSRSEDMLHD